MSGNLINKFEEEMYLDISPKKIKSIIGFDDASDVAIIFKDNPEHFEICWRDVIELYHYMREKEPEEAKRLEAIVIASEHTEGSSTNGAVADIEELVINKIKKRKEIGLKKYGVSVAENLLTEIEWLNHLQEELLDGAIYIEKLKQIATASL